MTESKIIQRYLFYLDYPNHSEVDLDSQSSTRALVSWLEDTKLRHLTPQDRLLKFEQCSSADWPSTFSWYCSEFGLPTDQPPTSSLVALLSRAIDAEHDDNAAAHEAESAKLLHHHIFDRAMRSPEARQRFEQSLRDFALKLGFRDPVLQAASSLEILQALRSLASRHFGGQAPSPEEQSFSSTLQDIPLGFHLDDPVLADAAKILRLLYLEDLREIQSDINELIETIQKFTAPSTTTTLTSIPTSSSSSSSSSTS